MKMIINPEFIILVILIIVTNIHLMIVTHNQRKLAEHHVDLEKKIKKVKK